MRCFDKPANSEVQFVAQQDLSGCLVCGLANWPT